MYLVYIFIRKHKQHACTSRQAYPIVLPIRCDSGQTIKIAFIRFESDSRLRRFMISIKPWVKTTQDGSEIITHTHCYWDIDLVSVRGSQLNPPRGRMSSIFFFDRLYRFPLHCKQMKKNNLHEVNCLPGYPRIRKTDAKRGGQKPK